MALLQKPLPTPPPLCYKEYEQYGANWIPSYLARPPFITTVEVLGNFGAGTLVNPIIQSRYAELCLSPFGSGDCWNFGGGRIIHNMSAGVFAWRPILGTSLQYTPAMHSRLCATYEPSSVEVHLYDEDRKEKPIATLCGIQSIERWATSSIATTHCPICVSVAHHNYPWFPFKESPTFRET